MCGMDFTRICDMKKAIVIGATSGIGRDAALRLAGEGWTVGAAGRRAEALASLRDEAGDRMHTAVIDVTGDDATSGLDALMGETGAPDLFLYVSGVGYQNRELDLDKEIRTVRTNCEGMVRIVGHFFNYVRSHPGEYSPGKKAHIAVVTSVAGTAGLGTAPAYSATKKMQQTYISALSQLAAMENIPVLFTDIRPGFVATDLLRPEKKYPMVMLRRKAADEVMKALRKRKRIHTFDGRYRIIVFLWRLIPRCIWERISLVKS